MTSTQLSQVSRPISWGEMDLFGHLNNVHYFRYIEDARIAFLDQFDFFSSGLQSIILKNECEYKSPVVYPDELMTRSYLTHIGTTSFSMLHEVLSKQQQQVVAIARSIIVVVDPVNFEKCAIPDQLKHSFFNYMELNQTECK